MSSSRSCASTAWALICVVRSIENALRQSSLTGLTHHACASSPSDESLGYSRMSLTGHRSRRTTAQGPSSRPLFVNGPSCAANCRLVRPGGTFDTSPAIHRWVRVRQPRIAVPEGRPKAVDWERLASVVPNGTHPPCERLVTQR